MKVLLLLIISLIIIYAIILARDILKHKDSIKDEKGSWIGYILYESLTFFSVSFGVSDSALNTLYLRRHDKVSFKNLPGTIIVGATIPTCCAALGYSTVVDGNPVLIVVIMISAALGAKFGSGIVARANGSAIRYMVAAALILSAIILAVKMFFVEGSGNLQTLPVGKMVIVAICEFVVSSLAMVGLGATPPMVAVLMLCGFDPVLALGTVILSTAGLCFVGAVSFVKQGTYNKKPVIAMAIFGSPCAVVATHFVQYVDTDFLQVLVLIVLLIGAVSVISEKGVE